jgi:hypothetical protein
MCVVAAKWFDKVGWVLAKNRDRNYMPTIHFRKSNRHDVERLYIWDDNTRYTEGLNEHGVCIVSASLMTKDDEKEHTKGEDTRDYYSPDGKKIRTALLEHDVKSALKKVLEQKLSGHTLVADQHHCYLVEAVKIGEDGYDFDVQPVRQGDSITRTNHGINLPHAGYQRVAEDENQTASRICSEARYLLARRMVQEANSPLDLVDKLTYHETDNPQLNPCRLDTRPSQLKTTGQLMLVPARRTLYYRPIQCDIAFDYWKINTKDSRVFFELLGMRPLLLDE